MTAPLVDGHAHLQAGAFARDLEEVLGAARAAGVRRILVPGWDVASSRRALELAAAHPWLDAAAGIHPHAAAAADGAAWGEIARLAADQSVVAIGETGLDYDRMFSPREVQLENLSRHVELALTIGRPLVLHCRSRAGARNAQDELLRELRAAGIAAVADRVPAVLHSFSGPPDHAAAALALGLAISFSGLVFRAGEEASAEVARTVPADRLLVETDAPYLSPPGAPRRRNAPEWVRITVAWLASTRGDDPDALGRRVVANYGRIFGAGRAAQPAVDPSSSGSAS